MWPVFALRDAASRSRKNGPFTFLMFVCLFRVHTNIVWLTVSLIFPYSYGKAAFCLEELMMTNPHNHLYCEQYAEVNKF